MAEDEGIPKKSSILWLPVATAGLLAITLACPLLIILTGVPLLLLVASCLFLLPIRLYQDRQAARISAPVVTEQDPNVWPPAPKVPPLEPGTRG